MAISVETTRRKFEQEVTHQLSVLTTALDHLEPAERQVEQRGVWTVSEQTAIVDRLIAFFTESNREIIYVATEEYLSAALIEGLSAAADRGVSVKHGGLSTELVETIRTEIPTVERVAVTEQSPQVSRLLLVDGSKTLVSVRPKQSATDTVSSKTATDGHLSTGEFHTETNPTTDGQASTANPVALATQSTETAIWGVGETNSLVVILKSIFGLHAGGPTDENS
jgi:sugar-specific transcriptional regulator TrmB